MQRITGLLVIAAWLLIRPDVPSLAAADWPFYPPRTEQPPAVESDWVRNGIDAFVLQQLNEHDLQPAKQATDAALVRRLYFDLIGLPPSPKDIRDYQKDSSPDRWERLVDRLLDDSRYGERWARLWLDLARYADTAGYEGDPDLPHAWRYRDYVIDAFNNDKPYDRFIKEQIAGDEFKEIMGAGELPEVPPEHVVALTFLRLAPFTEPRGDETRHEMLSEMTSTVGSVFLGLTVGCAKCHDHKYDDISTKDFYRMKAFFATVSIPPPHRGDIYQIGGPLPAAFYRDGEQEWAQRRRAEFEQQISESKTQLHELRAELASRLKSTSGFGMQAMGGSLGNDYVYGQSSVSDGQLHCSTVTCDGETWTLYSDGVQQKETGSNAGSNQGRWFGDLSDPARVSLGQYMPTAGVAQENGAYKGGFSQILIYDHVLSEKEHSEIDQWLTSGDPQAGPPAQGLRVWFDASDPDANQETPQPATGAHISAWTDRISRLTLSQTDTEKQPTLSTVQGATSKSVAVHFDDDLLTGVLDDADWAKSQQGSLVVVYSAEHTGEGYGFTVASDKDFIATFVNPVAATVTNADQAIQTAGPDVISADEKHQLAWLKDRERLVKQQIARLSPNAMSLRHSLGPPYEPVVPTSRVMVRGEYDNPGEVVEPGFLSCITGNEEPAEIRLDPFKRWPTRSRRMALADWIASADNPLTARVMVNRLWHWHFGKGIVPTPSDFGQLSGGPSHPELLDWLADRFVEEGWSIKKMHRLMVTSATWRQTSLRIDPQATEKDPDNGLLWHFSRRRLEAEAVRDAVLAVSGRLNPDQHGLPIFPPLPDDIEERVKYSNSKWNTQSGSEGRKRSIYIYQQRTLTTPFMQAFDSLVCDESRPRRSHSVTPLQALAMYNGRLVNEEAQYFAERVRETAGGADTESLVRQAVLSAFSRDAETDEVEDMSQLVESDDSGLTRLCRVLMNSNEFVYVD